MKSNSQAFTLIELLVVVLIIGILAAVVLPQYQVAVAKSRVSTMLAAVKAVADAQEVYYLANGKYAENLEELDVKIPSSCTQIKYDGLDTMFACENYFLLDNAIGLFADEKYDASVIVNYCPNHNLSWDDCKDNRDMQINFRLQHFTFSPSQAGKRYCFVMNNSKLGKAICSSFGFETNI